MLSTKDYSFFLSTMYFTSNDGFQNKFFYQPAHDTLELKKGAGNDIVNSWKSKGVFNSKRKPLFTVFLVA